MCPLSKDILRMCVNWVSKTLVWGNNIHHYSLKELQNGDSHDLVTIPLHIGILFFIELCVNQLSIIVRKHLRKQTYKHKRFIWTHHGRTSKPKTLEDILWHYMHVHTHVSAPKHTCAPAHTQTCTHIHRHIAECNLTMHINVYKAKLYIYKIIYICVYIIYMYLALYVKILFTYKYMICVYV